MDGYQYLPSLSLDEYEALKESIKEFGVIQPVIVDEVGDIIDGYHRAKACRELSVDYPTRVMEGLGKEQKENLSVSLNLKRRHLTKEQKKDLAISLREQGWTQERVSMVFEVSQRTISNWLSNFSKLDQASPRQPDKPDDSAKLREEISYYENLTKKQEREIEALKSREPKVIEKTVVKEVIPEDLQKRLDDLDARAADQEKEYKRRREALETEYKAHERALQDRINHKMCEIDTASKLNLDVSDLEGQKKSLVFELADLRAKREVEAEDSKTRERLRKVQYSITPLSTIIHTVTEKLSESPSNCGLSIEELEYFQKELEDLCDRADKAISGIATQIEKTRKGAKLHVV